MYILFIYYLYVIYIFLYILLCPNVFQGFQGGLPDPRWLGLYAPRVLRGPGGGLGAAGRGLEERQERAQREIGMWDMMGI